MDIYTLDDRWRMGTLIDGYFSAIWTERFNDHGDFEIHLPPAERWINLLVPDVWLIHPDTTEPMIIETSEIIYDEDGSAELKVTGRSATILLEKRVTPWYRMPEAETHTTAGYASMLIDGVIVTGGMGNAQPEDRIGYTSITNRSDDRVFLWFEPRTGQLWDNVKSMLDDIDASIKLDYSQVAPYFRFGIYDGNHQTNVVFRTIDDTLIQPKYLQSSKGYFNVASVKFRDGGIRYYYQRGTTTNVRGLDRKVLYVDLTWLNPDDFKDDPGAYSKTIDRLGKRAIAATRYQNKIDGEFSEDAKYGYRQTGENGYRLGDYVYVQGDYDSIKRPVRIMEYIWSDDESGNKAYPTFDTV